MFGKTLPLGTRQRHTSLSANFVTVEVLLVMVRLTEVQRGQAIALLMQRQRQQQVARHFGVHVSTIERLVRRLRETGRDADRPRSGRPRVTSQRQDRAIRLAHLRNRHLTATVACDVYDGVFLCCSFHTNWLGSNLELN